MEKKEMISEIVEEAILSHERIKNEFGDRWLLDGYSSCKSWLRGYFANEHDKKGLATAIEILGTKLL